MSHVVILGSNRSFIQRVQSIAGHVATALDRGWAEKFSHDSDLDSVLTAADGHLADMLILGDEIPVAESLTIAESLRFTYPAIEVVLVAEPDTDLVLRAMRAGIRDIVSGSIGEDDIKVLLHRVGENASVRVNSRMKAMRTSSDPHRVIVVSGPKGGVGRTTVATNLAVAISSRAQMDTVLVDLDLQFGDAGALLNLAPTYSIGDALEKSAALDTLLLKTFLTTHPSGFYVLCSAESPGLADEVTPAQITHLLRQLSTQFRYVVVDTSSGMAGQTIAAIAEASDLVLVSSMDRPGARAVRKTIDALGRLGITPPARHVLLNFAGHRAGLSIRDIETEIGLPVQVVVRRTPEVPISANLGQALVTRRRRGAVAKAMWKLVDLIHEQQPTSVGVKHKGVHVA